MLLASVDEVMTNRIYSFSGLQCCSFLHLSFWLLFLSLSMYYALLSSAHSLAKRRNGFPHSVQPRFHSKATGQEIMEQKERKLTAKNKGSGKGGNKKSWRGCCWTAPHFRWHIVLPTWAFHGYKQRKRNYQESTESPLPLTELISVWSVPECVEMRYRECSYRMKYPSQWKGCLCLEKYPQNPDLYEEWTKCILRGSCSTLTRPHITGYI